MFLARIKGATVQRGHWKGGPYTTPDAFRREPD